MKLLLIALLSLLTGCVVVPVEGYGYQTYQSYYGYYGYYGQRGYYGGQAPFAYRPNVPPYYTPYYRR